MQVIEHKAVDGKRRFTELAAILIGLFLIAGCENPGQVGSAITGDDTRVVVDTLEPGGFQEHSFVSYSGNYPFFSIGAFDDPLFGPIAAAGQLRPVLDRDSENVLTDSSAMRLRLEFDPGLVNGDSTASVPFDLLEVGSLWRGNAWKWDEPIDTLNDYTVGSFTAGTDSAVVVDLAEEWVNKYRSFYNRPGENVDSLYAFTFYGLAIVPRGTGKVLPVNVSESSFLVDSVSSSASGFEIPMNQWAYSLERDQGSIPADRSSIHSTLDIVISIDLQVASEVGTVNISRAELVLYADTELMEQTLDQTGPDAGRPGIPQLRLHRVRTGTAPESIDPGNAIIVAELDEGGAYRFNLTNLVKGGFAANSDEFTYYITAAPHNGTIRSTLLFNGEAPAELTPKLIITSIQTAEN